jgi:hypothetical protein
MATLAEITPLVIQFANTCSTFISPGAIVDPIVPDPSSLTSDQFSTFYFGLLNFLNQQSIKAMLPMEAVRASKHWDDIAVLIHHFQA